MPKLNQFETLVIDEFEEEKFHLPEHSHTYYEIIYIKKGCGVHHLNKNLLPYWEWFSSIAESPFLP